MYKFFHATSQSVTRIATVLLFVGLLFGYTLPAMADETIPEEAVVAEVAGAGDLIKSPEFSSVYYVGEDGKRYSFPNEAIYETWYEDYDDVIVVSADDLAQYSLGGNVDYQAGTSLIKLESDPTVYTVEPDGILRSLESEEQASKLYGDDWATRVDDLSPALWGSYEVGESLDEASGELPDGYITYDSDTGSYYYVADGELVLMSDEVLQNAEHLKEFATHEEDVADLHAEMSDLFSSADELTPEEFVTRAMTVFVPEDMKGNVPPSFALSDEAILKIYAEMIATWQEYSEKYAAEYVDSDTDGLSDEYEDMYGTDAFNADTDNDGFPDGVEISRGFNPGKVDNSGEGNADDGQWWEDESAWWKEWEHADISEESGDWYEQEMSWTREDGSVWSTEDGGNTWNSDSGETWDWEMNEDVWVNTTDTSIQWQWDDDYVWVHEDGSEWYSEDRSQWEDWDGYSWEENDGTWETVDGMRTWASDEGYTWEVGDDAVWTSDDGGLTWNSSDGEVWAYDASEGDYESGTGYEWSGDYGESYDSGDYESYEAYINDNPEADYDSYYEDSPSSTTSGSQESWNYDSGTGTWTSESGQTWSGDSGADSGDSGSYGSYDGYSGDSGSYSGDSGSYGGYSGGDSGSGSYSGGDSGGSSGQVAQ